MARNQKGIAGLLTVLIIVWAFAVGVSGFLVYKHYHHKKVYVAPADASKLPPRTE